MRMNILKMRQELSWDAIAKRHIDVYKEIINTHKQTCI
jgi:glycogen synthase